MVTVQAILQRDPTRSDRSVAVEAQCSAWKVARVRRDLESSGQLPIALVRIGADGRRRGVRGMRQSLTDRKRVLTRREARRAVETVLAAAMSGDCDAAMWLLTADQRARESA